MPSEEITTMARKAIEPINEERLKTYLELPTNSQELIPSGYAAKMLEIERRTLQAWVRNRARVRMIARRLTPKGELFFRKCDLHRFINEQMPTLA